MNRYFSRPVAIIAAFFVVFPLMASVPKVTVRTYKAKDVSRVLYGWHYEEIGMIGVGGLYAEMVRNRNFEGANLPEGLVIENGKYKDIPGPARGEKKIYQIDPLVGWVTTPLGCSPIRISLTEMHPLNPQNAHSMAVNVLTDIDSPMTAIHNRGYFGMAFRKGVPCRLSFYARSDGYAGEISFRLSDGNGSPCSKSVPFGWIGKAWRKYEAELVPDRDVKDGMLSIVPSKAGRFQLDMVSMFPSTSNSSVATPARKLPPTWARASSRSLRFSSQE